MTRSGSLLAAFFFLFCLVSDAEAQSPREKAASLNSDGVELFERGQYAQALRLFQAAIKEDPKAKEIRTNLGKTFAALGIKTIEESGGDGDARVYRRALEHLEQALIYWEGEGDTHHAVAHCHLQLKQLPSAIRFLENAVQRDPASFRSWRLLGVARERALRLGTALEAFRSAQKLRPGDAALARRIQRLGYDREALETYRSRKTARFHIYYPPSVDTKTALRIEEALESVSRALERRWNVRAPSNVIVFCYPPGEFSRRTGLHEDVGGAFDGRIRIAFPAELREGGLELTQVVRHETVHLLLHSLDPPPPRWIDEGLAQYLDGEPRPQWEENFLEILRKAPHVGIAARQRAFKDDDPATWGGLYLHSFLLFRHLAKTHKDFRLDMLVQQVGQGRSWDEAFRRVFDAGPEELDARWRGELRRGGGKKDKKEKK